MNLSELKNNILILNLKNLVGEERKILNQILEYLCEVSIRKLYLEMAYSSLFDFCVNELGYSKAAAYRRIEAVKLIKSLPKENQAIVKTKIQEGTINLTHLTQIQGFLKIEAKENNKNYSQNEKLQIIEKLESKSKLESERILAEISPQAIPQKPEVLRYLTKDKVEAKLVMPADLIEKLEKLKALKSHIKPGMNTVELIEILANQELKRLEKHKGSKEEFLQCALLGVENSAHLVPPAEPNKVKSSILAEEEIIKEEQKIKGSKSQREDKARQELLELQELEELKLKMGIPRSRYIPKPVQHKVWQRDQGQCSYKDLKTGRRCHSKHLLQIDHIQEFSKYGLSSNPENLRLLCSAHNQMRNHG